MGMSDNMCPDMLNIILCGCVHSKFFSTNSVSRGRFANENAGNIPTMNRFLGAFIKQLQKVTFNFIMSVLNSVDQIQFCLKSDKSIGHFV